MLSQATVEQIHSLSNKAKELRTAIEELVGELDHDDEEDQDEEVRDALANLEEAYTFADSCHDALMSAA